ncbi:hypothetical protein [Amycolatopsis sp. La24]|uniref:hypothetical protein n=1 Tax=Amycolatopsis sp. La24 TaxID=3028304 RepID=UPI0023B1D9DF|nr:hypothetical protein [Amycolatopsis sp. La24]
MDLSSLTGPAATLIAALAGLPLGQVAVRRRESRLRDGVQSNLSTIEKLREIDPGNVELLIGKIEQALVIQMDGLLSLEEVHAKEKKRNWPSLAAAFFLAALVSTPMWFLWMPARWYTWLLFIGLAVFALLLILSGFGAWSAGPPGKKEKK